MIWINKICGEKMDFNVFKILGVYGLVLIASLAFAMNKGALPWDFRLTRFNHPIGYGILLVFAIILIYWIV